MPHALVLQFPSAETLPSDFPSHLPEPDYADEKRMRFIVEEGFSLSEKDAALLGSRQIDHAVLSDMDFGELGLIVSDMDSTLITIECVDEIAAGVGLKDKVAEITERSMRGELDFEQSLRSRVALLAGLDEQILADVYENVLKLSPGAEFLLDECKRHDVKFLLVSGGFTFFTERLQQRLGFEYQHANVLEIENGRLTGRLKGRIIDAQAKADLLREYRSRLGLQPHQVLAMGDGANDIPMLKEAGIGVAYRAKPKAQAAADACINFGGLERVRGLFG
ncbi:phosphoserine phosphatase SerB [Neisseria meningitidis]|uniref:phosphoserine phosphatase SerB n=1 Tax=Neisseria meningitidis TaxID=487 RepID=UPI001C55E52E|nr:phosphoserine phosphatase SerB [Neisseria meningitidis]MBW3878711.1 phosphoserine phosphatase SerB [Neisseria meningitidis]MBW3883820.1 phosphoserine phosphatase SerB [Neisseria meningitidis]MBW3927083.1 phosphoserine phosphatase SerB [Neisseria meningitidis]MBW3941327.1 phosphoserine phosphatase SerB [Neisseria meningitidis]